MVGDSAGGNTDLGSGRGKRVFKAVILSQGQLKIMSNKCQLVKVNQTSCTHTFQSPTYLVVLFSGLCKNVFDVYFFIMPLLLDDKRPFSSP